MSRCQTQQGDECLDPHLWLGAQGNCPMAYAPHPPVPSSGTLNRTEHSELRGGVADAVFHRKMQTLQLSLDPLRAHSSHHGDLFRANLLPLFDQMSNDRGFPPG